MIADIFRGMTTEQRLAFIALGTIFMFYFSFICGKLIDIVIALEQIQIELKRNSRA